MRAQMQGSVLRRPVAGVGFRATRDTFRWRTVGAVAILILGVPGCIGSDFTSPSPVSIEDTKFAPQLNIDLSAMHRTDEGVYYQDLVMGHGAQLEPGDSIAFHYTVWLADGTQVETSTGGDPASVRVGVGRLLVGLEVGVPGIREGGKRKIIVPYDLAYGSFSVGIVPPYANLVFDLELGGIHGEGAIAID